MAEATWPGARHIDQPLEDYLASIGTIVRWFGRRDDSRATVLGIDVDGQRYVVKHACDDEAVGWLQSAARFHGAVSHPVIAPLLAELRTPTGLALVEAWAPGEVLHDAYDDTVPPRDDPVSAYRRLLALSATDIARVVSEIIDAHVAVTGAGFVAVDLYEGCVVFDFPTRRTSLIDLDHYTPGPYRLEHERQIGSRAFMAPEEFERDATIDERSTVYTLGRFALMLLGCDRYGPPTPHDFRGSPEQLGVALAACRLDPADRVPTVSALAQLWADAT